MGRWNILRLPVRLTTAHASRQSVRATSCNLRACKPITRVIFQTCEVVFAGSKVVDDCIIDDLCQSTARERLWREASVTGTREVCHGWRNLQLPDRER